MIPLLAYAAFAVSIACWIWAPMADRRGRRLVAVDHHHVDGVAVSRRGGDRTSCVRHRF